MGEPYQPCHRGVHGKGLSGLRVLLARSAMVIPAGSCVFGPSQILDLLRAVWPLRNSIMYEKHGLPPSIPR
jgi:hypothetical protein